MLSFFLKYKFFIITAAVVVAAAIIAFFMGGSISQPNAVPGTATKMIKETETPTSEFTLPIVTSVSETVISTEKTIIGTEVNQETAQATIPTDGWIANDLTEAPTDKYKTYPVPTDKPRPVEPQEQTTLNRTLTCTLSVSCATILEHMEQLDEELAELVPSDGWIIKPITTNFTEGESVFDVLVRICKEKKIHLDHSFTPAYNSAYIKGIGNLYEFDCGDQSGWIYGVNGWSPNYGCSRYVLQNGDTVSFCYTCQFGRDIDWSTP